jgi:rubrerythrin
MSAVKPGVWFCELCGEAVFSVGPPARCPACGAWPDLMVLPEVEPRVLARGVDYPPEVVAGGERMILQELNTSELYSRVQAASTHPLLRVTFRSLQRIEGRHATLLCAVFGKRRPAPTLRPDLSALNDAELIDLIRPREDETIEMYRQEIERVPGTELARVYQALIDIEQDHNELSEQLALIVS